MKTRFGYLDTMFLQGVVVLMSVCVVSFLLWEPHLEGRNATATPYEVYFHDPFLAYACTGAAGRARELDACNQTSKGRCAANQLNVAGVSVKMANNAKHTEHASILPHVLVAPLKKRG